MQRVLAVQVLRMDSHHQHAAWHLRFEARLLLLALHAEFLPVFRSRPLWKFVVMLSQLRKTHTPRSDSKTFTAQKHPSTSLPPGRFAHTEHGHVCCICVCVCACVGCVWACVCVRKTAQREQVEWDGARPVAWSVWGGCCHVQKEVSAPMAARLDGGLDGGPRVTPRSAVLSLDTLLPQPDDF